MKTIELIVSPDGQVRLETKGFTGSACRQTSAQLQQALGVSGDEQITSEFHSPAEIESLRQSQ